MTAHPQPFDHAHHFDDAHQQHEAVALGMWSFLVTEIMFFGGAFAAFFVYRYRFGQGFAQAGAELDVFMGSINTGVLLCSSLSMALAVHAAQLGRRKALTWLLLLTMALGAAFLAIKGFEYAHKFHEGHVPTPGFHWEHGNEKAAHLFFSFYFVLTGVHALHMVIGIGVMACLLRGAWRGKYTTGVSAPNFIEMTGLYWHFVDIVWIFLFPILYLSHH